MPGGTIGHSSGQHELHLVTCRTCDGEPPIGRLNLRSSSTSHVLTPDDYVYLSESIRVLATSPGPCLCGVMEG